MKKQSQRMKEIENQLKEYHDNKPWYEKIAFDIECFIGRLVDPIKMFPQEVKWFVQRGRRGYSDRDVWDLDSFLAQVISNSVHDLKDGVSGYPGDGTIKNANEWKRVLGKIEKGFKSATALNNNVEDFVLRPKLTQKREQQFDEGGKLFIKHFFSLWD